jgi:hypothetical protein
LQWYVTLQLLLLSVQVAQILVVQEVLLYFQLLLLLAVVVVAHPGPAVQVDLVVEAE